MPLAYLIASLVNAVFVVYLLVRAPRSQARTAAIFVIAALSLWQIGEFGVLCATDAAAATLWIKFTYAALTLLPLTFFFFTMWFPVKRERFWNVRVLQVLPVVPAGLLLALLHGPLLIAGATKTGWGFTRMEGPAFMLLEMYMPVLLLVSLGNLFVALRLAPTRLQQIQCWYVIAGAVCPVTFGILDLNVLQPLGVKGFHYLVTPLAGIAPTTAVVYALMRYRLFDVPAALRSGLIHAALVALLLLPCLGTYVLAENLLGSAANAEREILVAALLVLAGFVFPRIRIAAHETVEHALFRHRREYRRILTNTINDIATILEMRPLSETLSARLSEALQVEEVGLWIRHAGDSLYVRMGDKSGDSEISNGDARCIDQWLAARPSPWSADDGPFAAPSSAVARLAGRPCPRSADDGEQRGDAIEAVFARLGVCICFPLRSKDRPLGLLTLGPRARGRLYVDDEIAFLITLANQVAIAAENARLYEALKESKQMLQRASRLSAVGTLAAGLAHEIRNPLVAVQTFLQILPERLGDPEVTVELRKVALEELQRVSRLITDLLGMARSPVATFEHASLGDVVEQVVRLLEVSAEKQQVRLKRTGGAVPQGYIDVARLKQALLNLIMNAIQASPPGGEVTIATRSGTDPAGRAFVELAVRDQGPGIAPAHLEAIFHPFFTTKDTGTGLGLAVAQQIITDHGGGIRVESEEGAGATFVIQLPLEEKPPAEIREMPLVYGLGKEKSASDGFAKVAAGSDAHDAHDAPTPRWRRVASSCA